MCRFRFIPLIFPVMALAAPGERVAVLANADDPQSVALARHYLAARGIPENNLITLPLPAEEEIDWDTFVARIRNPLLDRLVKHKLITGEAQPGYDAEGRTRFITHASALDHLVLCKGVPLKIRNDPARLEAHEKEMRLPPQFRVNEAAVDSELALLPRAATPLAGVVPNPRHNALTPPRATTYDTLMVARLDGPTYADATRLIDGAIEAERIGLLGRAYIDLGGPHHSGDEKLALTAEVCRKIFLDTEVENTPALFAEGCRFDAPAVYFGWYAGAPSGVFASPSVRLPVGAIAMHIHSFSAATLRSAETGWVGPLVARGAALTVGNVYEPYLEFSHSPALLMTGLASGMCAGEAAAYSNPVLSWQTIFVGDPLYRPFTHDVPAQLDDFDKRPDPAHAYALLRAAAQLDGRGKHTEADDLLTRAAPRLPVLALARGRLDRALGSGRRPVFKTADLAPVAEDPGLVYTTAEQLSRCGLSSEALALLEQQHALGVRFDARASALALALGQPALARKLAPPPPPTPPAAPQNQKNSASPKAAG